MFFLCSKSKDLYPISSMGLVYLPTFGCLFMVHVGKYAIHGWYGYRLIMSQKLQRFEIRLLWEERELPKKLYVPASKKLPMLGMVISPLGIVIMGI